MAKLTKEQELKNLIANDARNIDLFRGHVSPGLAAGLPYLIAGCAARYVQAMSLVDDEGAGDAALMAYENLVDAVGIWGRQE